MANHFPHEIASRIVLTVLALTIGCTNGTGVVHKDRLTMLPENSPSLRSSSTLMALATMTT